VIILFKIGSFGLQFITEAVERVGDFWSSLPRNLNSAAR
jgi:hypothetical protein